MITILIGVFARRAARDPTPELVSIGISIAARQAESLGVKDQRLQFDPHVASACVAASGEGSVACVPPSRSTAV